MTRLTPRTKTLLGAALGIAIVTAVARVVGFGRVAVATRTIGTGCLGDTYGAVNAVPNVVFEVVAGGALAGAVVPLLAAAVARGDHEQVERTTGVLLTWTVLLLTPAAILLAVLAPYVVPLLLGGAEQCPGAVETGTRMLLVFLPQVVLYGIAVVLTGVLQAHRRFLGPALAPLLSSLVVMSAYLVYAAQGRDDLAGLSRTQELVLSVGTTLGVAVLGLSLLVPLRRAGVRVRPGLRLPAGDGARLRSLAGAGAAGLAAQQVALLVALRLAWEGPVGAVVVFQLATALFLLPWAVLAVPVATSAFPALSASAADGDELAYGATASTALRACLLVSAAGAALLAVASEPLAQVLVLGAPGPATAEQLARTTVAFAPGLVGYGLIALLGRALLARGDSRTAGLAVTAGWLAVAAADVVLVLALPDADRAVLLGVGNSVGLSLAAVWLLVALRRRAGSGATSGAARTALATAAAALAAVAAGIALPLPTASTALGAVAVLALVGTVAAAAYVLVARLVDPAGVRAVLRG